MTSLDIATGELKSNRLFHQNLPKAVGRNAGLATGRRFQTALRA